MLFKRLYTIFVVAFALTYGNARDVPKHTTTTSFLEVESNTLFYGLNRIHPNDNQMQIIDQYVDDLRNNPDTYIQVTSHTDAIGDWETNLNISRRRAIAIAEYLRMNGIPQDRIVLDWLGESDPIYFSDEEKHKNRRSVIRIIKKVTRTVPDFSSIPDASPLINNTPQKEEITSPNIEIVPEVEDVAEVESIVVIQPTIRKSFINLQTIPYLKTPIIQYLENHVRIAPKPVIVPEPELIEKGEEVKTDITPVSFGNKSGDLVYQKSILFVDALTMKPVMVDVDLTSSEGKDSFTTSDKGILNVFSSETEIRKMDIFAHGYFYTSIEINPDPFQQTVKLQPTIAGEKFEISNLKFVPGKSVLMSESRAELEKLYLSLMMNPSTRIEIGGHINVPNKKAKKLDKKKFQLSVARARAVYNYLAKKGISKKSMTYKGYGNSEMVFPKAKTEEEKAQNRRVEVKILK